MNSPPLDPLVHSLVRDYLHENRWNLPQAFADLYLDITSKIRSLVIRISTYTRIWKESISMRSILPHVWLENSRVMARLSGPLLYYHHCPSYFGMLHRTNFTLIANQRR